MLWYGQSNHSTSSATLDCTISTSIQPNSICKKKIFDILYSKLTTKVAQSNMVTLCESNQYLFSFFRNMSLAFNICLCYDLVKTLKDPFSPGARRLKFYIMFSLGFSVFFAYF
jgi:hypothetical protein